MIATRLNVLSRILESAGAFVLMVCVVLWADGRQAPIRDLAEFLQVRLTLTNACFALIFAVLWMECFKAADALIESSRTLAGRLLVIAGGCLTMCAVVAMYLTVRGSIAPKVQIVGVFMAVALGFNLIKFALRRAWRGDSFAPQNVIILGSGRRASMAWRELRTRFDGRHECLGFVDDRGSDQMPPDIAQRHLCGTARLSNYLLHNSVHQMIVATPLRSQYDMTQRAISIAEAAGVRVFCMSDSFTLMHRRSLAARSSFFTELLPNDEQHQLANGCKRVMDVLVAAGAMIALLPLLAVIAILVKITSRGPVFFTQERYGYHRRRFRMWKFRSMVVNAPELMAQLESKNEADGPIFKIQNDPRITPVGKYLRKLSLDELPQLWNVLIGDMSLVGPRPMSLRDVSRFSDAQLMRRFTVKPGITGLWQVSGRSSLSFEKWMMLDFRYIDEWSFGLDLKILARTVPVVLKRTGAA